MQHIDTLECVIHGDDVQYLCATLIKTFAGKGLIHFFSDTSMVKSANWHSQIELGRNISRFNKKKLNHKLYNLKGRFGVRWMFVTLNESLTGSYSSNEIVR